MQQSVRKGITKSLETVMAVAYLTGNQAALNGNAWNKINLNGTLFDLGQNFDTTNHKFIAPVTGLYRIRGDMHFTSVITASRYMSALYQNGVAIKYAQQHASKAEDISVPVETEVFLKETDYIELYGQPVVGGGVNTVAGLSGSLYTNLLVRLITKEGVRQ